MKGIYEKRQMRVYFKNDEGGEFIFNGWYNVDEVVTFVFHMMKLGWYLDQESWY